MKSKKSIRIGSRGSKLATFQAESVREQLASLNPNIEFEMVIVTTTGDRNQTIALEKLGGEGVFVKELEEALLCQKINIAVHSLKDMLTVIPDGLRLAAVPQRVDPRDALISPAGKLNELPRGARIGTGSQRRAVQLCALRPDLKICGLRGNIDTRIRKAFSNDLDGIIMAAAALVRLGMRDKIAEYLPVDDFIPAVGQGALGIEIRADDTDTFEVVSPLNHEPTYRSVIAERAFLRMMGGGCRAPIAALGTTKNGVISLRGIVADAEGSGILRAEAEGKSSEPEKAGNNLAQKMFDLGAASLIGKDGFGP